MKLNLTTTVLGIALTAISFTSIRQCSSIRKTEKAYELLSEDNLSLEKQLYTQIGAHDHLLDEIEQLSLSISTEKSKREAITASYRDLKKELKQTPVEDVLESLLSGKPLEGELYEIDSSRVMDYGMAKLKMKECEEVTSSLIKENFMLRLSVDEYAAVSTSLLEDLDDCTLGKIELEKEVREGSLREDKLKGKVVNNRSIAGVLGVVLLVIAIL